MKTESQMPSSPEGEQLVSDLARSFSDALKGTVEPIRAQLAAIEESIVERETELRELRALRTSAQRLVAFVEPAPKKGKAGAPARPKAADHTVDAIAVFLREHYPNGNEFTARQVADDPGFTVASRATVTNALGQLADSGVVRLASIGQHGSKHYKLVGDGSA